MKTLGPGGQPVLHTDWLPMGALLSGDSGLWYAALQLYRIPERPGVSEPLRSVDAVRPILSGASLISLDPHRGPHAVTEVR